MYWVGKENTGRVGRSSASAPVCETRWIVPTKPYQAPKGSWEAAENAMLMGIGVVAIAFGFFIIILSAM
jgi:hypothetical protein